MSNYKPGFIEWLLSSKSGRVALRIGAVGAAGVVVATIAAGINNTTIGEAIPMDAFADVSYVALIGVIALIVYFALRFVLLIKNKS